MNERLTWRSAPSRGPHVRDAPAHVPGPARKKDVKSEMRDKSSKKDMKSEMRDKSSGMPVCTQMCGYKPEFMVMIESDNFVSSFGERETFLDNLTSSWALLLSGSPSLALAEAAAARELDGTNLHPAWHPSPPSHGSQAKLESAVDHHHHLVQGLGFRV